MQAVACVEMFNYIVHMFWHIFMRHVIVEYSAKFRSFNRKSPHFF